MDENNEVRVQVDGRDHAGWLEVEISASIERQARSFTLAITESWPGAAAQAGRVRPGATARVFIGADPVVTGHVDATPISYDAGQIRVSLRGRSKTADLVDCAPVENGGQFRNRRVEQVARSLARPYDVEVRADVATGAAIRDHQVEPGETVFESIARMLELRGLLSTDDAEGVLVLTRAGEGRAADALELGRNVLSASADFDMVDRFSEYRVLGQQAGSDLDYGETISGVRAVAEDPAVPRRRVTVITADGQVDTGTARERARWTAAKAAGETQRARVRVQGWRQSDGRLWQVNERTRLTCPVLGLDREMLIAEVTYRLDSAGTTTRLSLAPQETFEMPPAKQVASSEISSPWAGDTGWEEP